MEYRQTAIARRLGPGVNSTYNGCNYQWSMESIQRGTPSKIISGRHSYGIDQIKIKSWNEGAHLYVGSFCSIARDLTVFLGGNHRSDWCSTFPFGFIRNDIFPSGEVYGSFVNGELPYTNGHVIIEDDVWIGEGCTIMSGIRIGAGSVIASKSVVVKDVAPYTIAGGNPAKHIKDRFPLHISKQLLEIRWWDKTDEEINRIVPLLQQPLTDVILGKIKVALMA